MAEVRAERTDVDIQDDVEGIIAHYPPLTHDRHRIQVVVQNGMVAVSGHTRTAITRRYLVGALEKIPGVTGVDSSHLFSDDAIRLEVGRVIPVGVIANILHGGVVLTGRLPDGKSEADIVAAVAQIPGVRVVKTQFG